MHHCWHHGRRLRSGTLERPSWIGDILDFIQPLIKEEHEPKIDSLLVHTAKIDNIRMKSDRAQDFTTNAPLSILALGGA